MISTPTEARDRKVAARNDRNEYYAAMANENPTGYMAGQAPWNRTHAWFIRARAARRSWHAAKAAWIASLIAAEDPYADARADLAADRAADWKDAGF